MTARPECQHTSRCRPDLVLYLNGIATAVIELKRSSVEVADGIRQLITNLEPIFNLPFFPTVQLLLAGNDAQGLRYGTVTTREEFFIQWKAAPLPDERTRQREGGVIWHTQGSGKSILMVLLAKWLLEHDPEARILIVTDRDELDEQIEGVMKNAGVVADDAPSPRIATRVEFVAKLGATVRRLLCALIHKFDPADLNGPPPPIHGRFYVFVDECHRTQGGDMNRQKKRWLESAIFIGLTGTPLLRRDKQTTRDVCASGENAIRLQRARFIQHHPSPLRARLGVCRG